MPKKKSKTKKKTFSTSSVMEEALKDKNNLPRKLKKGQILEGRILKICPNEVWIDLGAKAEGVILGRELKDEKDFLSKLEVDDPILVCVTQIENEHGQIVLSIKRAGMERRWKTLEERYRKKEPIKVRAHEYNKGGLIVDFSGIKGFLPISQISSNRLIVSGGTTDIKSSLESLLRRELTVQVIELNRLENKLIFSEKAALGETDLKYNTEVLAHIKKGEKIKGKVTRIVPFGILVNLGGVEGLVHISEVSWDRLKRPEELVKVGEEIEVLVLDKDEKNRRIHLSLKRLTGDPWEKVEGKYKIGQEVDGFVTKIAPFGVFVRLEEGIDGLVYNTQLVESGKELQPQDKGKFKILSLDVPSKRMNLLPL